MYRFISHPQKSPVQASQQWYYRYYPITKNYLGVDTKVDEVYVLGNVFNGLKHIDTLQSLLEKIPNKKSFK